MTTAETLVAAGTDLTARLAEWIESEGIAKGDVAASTAAALTEDDTMRPLAAVLLATGDAPEMLRDAATGVADIASMDPADHAAELFWHGHDPY